MASIFVIDAYTFLGDTEGLGNSVAWEAEVLNQSSGQ